MILGSTFLLAFILLFRKYQREKKKKVYIAVRAEDSETLNAYTKKLEDELKNT